MQRKIDALDKEAVKRIKHIQKKELPVEEKEKVLTGWIPLVRDFNTRKSYAS